MLVSMVLQKLPSCHVIDPEKREYFITTKKLIFSSMGFLFTPLWSFVVDVDFLNSGLHFWGDLEKSCK